MTIKKRRSWNRGIKTSIDGYNFPSKLHASVYCTLKLMEKAGEINNIRCEVTLHLIGKLKFKVDFVVFDLKRECDVAHEAKGAMFPRYRTIVQAWPGCGPMDLTEWMGTAERPFISRIIKGIK